MTFQLNYPKDRAGQVTWQKQTFCSPNPSPLLHLLISNSAPGATLSFLKKTKQNKPCFWKSSSDPGSWEQATVLVWFLGFPPSQPNHPNSGSLLSAELGSCFLSSPLFLVVPWHFSSSLDSTPSSRLIFRSRKSFSFLLVHQHIPAVKPKCCLVINHERTS